MIQIHYTEYFVEFVGQFPKEKQELIKKIIEDYCDHKKLLPRPKASAISKEIQKVAIHEADIVIFYVDYSVSWLILKGVKIHERAA